VNDKWIRFAIALTIPGTFVLVLIGATVRDRVLPDVVSGGLIAVLGSIVAIFSARYANAKSKDDQEIEDEDYSDEE
jgi:uncharacterized membrane protein YdjX (TVP38/TMEM64 family)